MPKIVNGSIVTETAEESAGGSGAGAGSAGAVLQKQVSIAGKQVPLWAVGGGAGVLAFVLAGSAGLFYVFVAAVLYGGCQVFAAGNARPSSGGGARRRAGGGGANIKGFGDLPKPPPRAGG
mmetsp:Transcript_33862/g.94355  ORF Transcript_33862/g.94355 Transcript_33862/m.94355 type:complete len:121 (-) Transcript_33862:655-1017(-)